MLKYRMSAASLNRWTTPGKKTDGAGLFWIRNINGSLTAKQRVKSKDIKIDIFNGKLTPAMLDKVRQTGINLKTSPIQSQNGTAFLSSESKLSEAWEEFYLIMTSSSNSSWSPYTAKQNKNRIEAYIKPTGLWHMQVQHIHVAELFAVLKSVRQEKHDTESKIRGVLSKVFTHLLSMRLIKDNPVLSLPDLYRNLEKPKKVEHLPAELSISELGNILNENDYSSGSFLVKKAVELQAYTCQRSLEIAGAMWSEINFDTGIWTISRNRMKVKLRNYDQVLHLSPYVVKLLKTIPKKNKYVFPANTKLGHISRDSMSKRMRRTLNQQGKHTPHGWRAALKTSGTIASDIEGRPLFAKEWIECVLDHDSKDKIEAAYQRGRPIEGAGKVLSWWAEQLNNAREKARAKQI